MCPAAYYQKAVRRMQALHPGRGFEFFVFSDDMEWCREHLSFPGNAFFVGGNVKNDSYKDMALLSACKHQIMANSTFSWWAAWLNTNPGKTVVYPSTARLTCASMPEPWICVEA